MRTAYSGDAVVVLAQIEHLARAHYAQMGATLTFRCGGVHVECKASVIGQRKLT